MYVHQMLKGVLGPIWENYLVWEGNFPIWSHINLEKSKRVAKIQKVESRLFFCVIIIKVSNIIHVYYKT